MYGFPVLYGCNDCICSVCYFWYLLVLFGPVFCLGPSGSYHVAVCVAVPLLDYFCVCVIFLLSSCASFHLCVLFPPGGIRVGFHCVVVLVLVD